jgi:trimethylamine:corrinoid methyltransferase-like protein
MLEKGPGKDFIGESHTVRHMREEFFVPRLANRAKRGTPDASQDAQARAREFVRALRAREPESRLPADVRREILARFPEIRQQAGRS